MNITFKDKDLEKCAVNAKYRMKTLGASNRYPLIFVASVDELPS